MKLVLDANVAIMWVLPEPQSPTAVELRNDFRSGTHELLAPDTLPVEFAHALTRAERKGLLALGEAMMNVVDVMTIGVDFHPYLSLLPRAVELSSQFRIGVFDCVYVALAEREQCRVVTADKRMVAAFPALVVALGSL